MPNTSNNSNTLVSTEKLQQPPQQQTHQQDQLREQQLPHRPQQPDMMFSVGQPHATPHVPDNNRINYMGNAVAPDLSQAYGQVPGGRPMHGQPGRPMAPTFRQMPLHLMQTSTAPGMPLQMQMIPPQQQQHGVLAMQQQQQAPHGVNRDSRNYGNMQQQQLSPQHQQQLQHQQQQAQMNKQPRSSPNGVNNLAGPTAIYQRPLVPQLVAQQQIPILTGPYRPPQPGMFPAGSVQQPIYSMQPG